MCISTTIYLLGAERLTLDYAVEACGHVVLSNSHSIADFEHLHHLHQESTVVKTYSIFHRLIVQHLHLDRRQRVIGVAKAGLLHWNLPLGQPETPSADVVAHSPVVVADEAIVVAHSAQIVARSL